MILLLILHVFFVAAFSQELYIAAASSLNKVLPEIVRKFEREHPNSEIKISFASSGHLYAQIKGGAPYQVFISADTLYPKKLIKDGFALKDSYTEYASGLLAVYGRVKGDSLKDVLKGAKRIAVANPRHAPYGKAAVELLKRIGLFGEVRRKLIYGANVSQAVQFVHSGGADMGIVAYSLVISMEGVKPIDRRLYSPIIHAAVVTSKGKGDEIAYTFLRFLTSPPAKEVLKRHGFLVPR